MPPSNNPFHKMITEIQSTNLPPAFRPAELLWQKYQLSVCFFACLDRAFGITLQETNISPENRAPQ